MDEPLYSMSAERAVLGGMMLDATAWERVHLDADDFGRDVHREIYRAITVLRSAGDPADPVIVGEYLDAHTGESEQGHIAYLGELVQETSSAANVAGYADIVRDMALRRRVIEASTSLADGARDRSRSLSEIVDGVQREVLSLSMRAQPGGLVPMSDLVIPFLEDTERRGDAPDGMVGLATGHADIDGLLYGLEDSDLVIVAGRPSMGKTMLVGQWLEHIAAHYGTTAFFSLEMSKTQLVRRSAARASGVPFAHLRSGRLDQGEWQALSDAMSTFNRLPLYIDDTPAISIADLAARARRLHRRSPLKALAVDYLQIVQCGESVRRDARADQQIGAVATGLKNLAKELDIPVIAIAQLNRSLEQRNDKRPVMSDLREAGQIEQDADVILFVYRDEVYHSDTPNPGVAEVICRKQRNGPVGTVHLSFLGESQRFENLAPEHVVPMSQTGHRGRMTAAMEGY